MSPRVLIVGGGIAGLTTAAALARRGVDVRVVEQAPRFEPVGAGITIQANATAVLQALDIELPDEDVVPSDAAGSAFRPHPQAASTSNAGPIDRLQWGGWGRVSTMMSPCDLPFLPADRAAAGTSRENWGSGPVF